VAKSDLRNFTILDWPEKYNLCFISSEIKGWRWGEPTPPNRFKKEVGKKGLSCFLTIPNHQNIVLSNKTYTSNRNDSG
jgi:hypothetical protein